MKTKEVILHVGLHKTGTTYVQNMLYDNKNKEILNNNGIIFIEEWEENNGRPMYSAFTTYPNEYHMNIREGLLGEKLERYNENNKNILIEYLQMNDLLLISGEDMSLLDHVELENLKKFIISNVKTDIKLKIIIYVRNPKTFASSVLQEQIKAGKSDFDVDLDAIGERVKKFIDVFGLENVQVLSFEDSCRHESGIGGYFFEKVGMPTEQVQSLFINNNNANISMSLVAVNIAIEANLKEPMLIDNQMNPKRKAWEMNSLLKIQGNKFQVENMYIAEPLNSIKSDMIWLKDMFDIDYLDIYQENFEIENIEDKDGTFDRVTIVDAYLNSTEFVKSSIIEYFEGKDANLLNTLSQIDHAKSELVDGYENRINTHIQKFTLQIEAIQNELSINKNDLARTQEEKARIEEEKARIEEEKARIEEEKARVEEEKENIEVENCKLSEHNKVLQQQIDDLYYYTPPKVRNRSKFAKLIYLVLFDWELLGRKIKEISNK